MPKRQTRNLEQSHALVKAGRERVATQLPFGLGPDNRRELTPKAKRALSRTGIVQGKAKNLFVNKGVKARKKQ